MVTGIIKALYALVFIFVMLPIFWITEKARSVKDPFARDILNIILLPFGVLNDFLISPKVEGQLGHDHKLSHDPNWDINRKLK